MTWPGGQIVGDGGNGVAVGAIVGVGIGVLVGGKTAVFIRVGIKSEAVGVQDVKKIMNNELRIMNNEWRGCQARRLSLILLQFSNLFNTQSSEFTNRYNTMQC